MQKIWSRQQVENSIGQRYQHLAIVIYIGTFIIGTFAWFVGHTPRAAVLQDAELTRLAIFFAAILILLLLDLYKIGHAHFQATRSTNGSYLVGRILLVVLAFLVADLQHVLFIYLLIFLYAYLTGGRMASICVGAVSLVGLFIDLAYGPSNDFISKPDFEKLLTFGLMTAVALFLGHIITKEAESREQANRLLDELSESHRQLEKSMEQIAELATTDERNRLARDIHDSLGHYLTAINIQLEMAIKLHERQPDMAKEAAIQAKAATRAALQDVRQSVSSLREGGERFCLRDALDTLSDQVKNEALKICVEIEGDEVLCPQKVLLILYRAAQEGFTNVVKHATATEVHIQIMLLPQLATFSIQDNGVGFIVESLNGQQGYGLQGILERVELVDGVMDIESGSGQGTALHLRIPYT